MKILYLKSHDMRDPDFRTRFLNHLVKEGVSRFEMSPTVQNETLLNYLISVNDGNSSGSIDFDAWPKIYEKVRALLKVEKPVEVVEEWTPEMYENAKERFRLLHKHRFLHLPVLLAFDKPVSLVSFQDRGLQVFYYGKSEHFGNSYVVLLNQIVSTLPSIKGCTLVGKKVILRETYWHASDRGAQAILNALNHTNTQFTWGMPWS